MKTRLCQLNRTWTNSTHQHSITNLCRALLMIILLVGTYAASLAQGQTCQGYILGAIAGPDISGDKGQLSKENAGSWLVQTGTYLPPQLHAFLPKKDVPGTIVTIKGKHLLTTAAVLFNGLEAAYEVISEEQVKATVPANATTGKITLVTAGGTVTSPGSFRVRQPAISVSIPGLGKIGATVFLAGERLNTTREVYFNGVKVRQFKVLSDWAIHAVVPPGATTGKLRVVLAGGGKATSKAIFMVLSPNLQDPAVQPLARKEMSGETIVAPAPAEPKILAYPNPFHQKVTCRFTLPRPQPVRIKVYDLLGREVSLLYQAEEQAPQTFQVEWHPQPQQPNGFYIIRLQTPGQVSQQKVLLFR